MYVYCLLLHIHIGYVSSYAIYYCVDVQRHKYTNAYIHTYACAYANILSRSTKKNIEKGSVSCGLTCIPVVSRKKCSSCWELGVARECIDACVYFAGICSKWKNGDRGSKREL
jgi:hypothetical protein